MDRKEVDAVMAGCPAAENVYPDQFEALVAVCMDFIPLSNTDENDMRTILANLLAGLANPAGELFAELFTRMTSVRIDWLNAKKAERL